MSKRVYYPQLDSLRGLSVIAIFIFHTIKIQPGNGLLHNFIAFLSGYLYLGLDVFFVLSSFLLIWLGLNEYKIHGSFSFKNFFLRRILRIWPLYYLLMIFAFIILPVGGHILGIHISLPPPVWYLFFISNFYYADHVYFLRILWTLSVEEQFYVLLGFILKFLSRYLLWIFCAIFSSGLIYYLYAITQGQPYYTHTLTYFFNFGAGGIAAYLVFKNGFFVRLMSRLPGWLTIVFYSWIPIYFIIFFILKISAFNNSIIYSVALRCLFVLYIALFIVEQIVNTNRSRFLERNSFLIFTGKISFGFYCFHGIVNTLAATIFPGLGTLPQLVRAIILFAITYGISVLSFFYFESPFLRLKDKFRE